MAVAKRKPKMRRTQISLTAEEYDMVRRMAEERGVSRAQAVRDAIHGAAEEGIPRYDPLRDIVGILEGGDPDGSVKHDEFIYDPRIR